MRIESTNFPKIPGYTIESVIGSGGFATVYLARQHTLQRAVALKIMDPGLASDPLFRERFLREARDTAVLSDHPNIVTIHDVGHQDNHYFIAIQYLPGPNLKLLLESCAVCQDPVTIILRIAAALDFAHSKGFVHRDIKPANILFNESNEAVLADFGIAKTDNVNTHLTQLGTILGTAKYMSPEQAQGETAIDGRTDLYSLGIVFFELLTNQAPYQSLNPLVMMNMHLNAPIPRLPERWQMLQPVIDKLMAKDPVKRYANAGEVIHDLNAYDRQCNNKAAEKPSKMNDKANADTLLPVAFGSLVILVGVLIYLFTQPKSALEDNIAACLTLSTMEIEDRNRLLNVAQMHESVGRRDHPPGANALDAYYKVLAIDPCNVVALNSVKRISPKN